ncbi:hypothetical protein RugamoR1_21160 [Rugamonas sp. R1(2021)]
MDEQAQMEKLVNGGVASLWSRWSIDLPPACFERNEDGSWSAWGADWTLDVSIVDTSGDASGKPVSALQLLGAVDPLSEISGQGWIGAKSMFDETVDGKRIFRLSGKLCSENTVLLGMVSFFRTDQLEFADSILRKVRHVDVAETS